MSTVRIAGSKKHSSVNGPGVRYVLFMQGCTHKCPECQNPETHDLQGGMECDLQAVIDDILSTRYLDGLTLSGGDPLMQPEATKEIARQAKDAGMNIWLYTGYTWKQVVEGKAGEAAKEVLPYIDVVVDGPFVESLKSEDTIWRGSSNQHLVDVKRSLETGCEVEYSYP